MKAVVLETRNGEAAVLVNDGTVRIVRGVYNVGDIIDYRLRPRFVQWIAAVAAMVVLVGGTAAMWLDRNYVTYAEVSLDVNPSIIYSLNKHDRVLSVRAVNEDAESIVTALEQEGVRSTSLSEAVEKTMSILDNQGYLDSSTDDYVLINVSADDADRQTRLSDEVETAMTAALKQNHTIEYRIDHSDRKTAREADEADMSIGRYAAWQQDEGASDVKDYADKPVRELMDRNPDTDQQDSEAKPDSVPADDPLAPPSHEANDRRPSSLTQDEEASDAPASAQVPVEKQAPDVPSDAQGSMEKPGADAPSNQAPAEKTAAETPPDAKEPVESPAAVAPSNVQAPAEKPAADIPSDAKEPVENPAADMPSNGQAMPDSNNVSSEQRGSKEVPSEEKGESVPKQDSSSDRDRRADQSNPESGQPDKPNNGDNPSKSQGSDKSTPHDADPGSKR